MLIVLSFDVYRAECGYVLKPVAHKRRHLSDVDLRQYMHVRPLGRIADFTIFGACNTIEMTPRVRQRVLRLNMT